MFFLGRDLFYRELSASPVMPASIRVSARTGTHAPYDRFNVTEQTSLRQAPMALGPRPRPEVQV
jgi:hypothetical protein